MMPRQHHSRPGASARDKRRAPEVFAEVAGALDEVEDDALREKGRDTLREHAAQMGMTLHSVEVTDEPIPDPALEALPESEKARIEAVARRMYEDPASLHDELVALVAQHPGIPLLRNHLAGSLQACGDHDGARVVIEETVRLFPDYVFAFANYVMMLVGDGEVDRARAIMEDGPRGPMLSLFAFAPTRTAFHSTEVVCYAGMTGHYFIATDRLDAAKVSLKMMQEILPDHPQTMLLAERITNAGALAVVFRAVERLGAPKRKKASKKTTGKKAAGKKGKGKKGTRKKTASEKPAPKKRRGKRSAAPGT